MDNELLLLSGNDIPFVEAQITIHQPTIREIAYIGEEAFFTGCELINFSKNILSEQDKINLEDKTNFDILIAILEERNAVMQKNRSCVLMALALLFPSYAISLKKDSIALKKEGTDEECYLNRDNYEEFQQIIKQMFSFNTVEQDDDFKPDGRLASKIAEKLRKRHEKLAQIDKKSTKVDIYSRYVSILSTGLKINIEDILNYTPYQLFDQLERYRLKQNYDIFIKAQLAGAKDLKDPEDWMKDVHSMS